MGADQGGTTISSHQPYRPVHAASAEELAARRNMLSDSYQAFPPETPPQTPPPAQGPPHAGLPAAPLSPQMADAPIPAVLSQTTGTHWPQYVNNHRLIGSLVAGFFASHVADMIGYWMSGLFGLPKLDFALFNGLVLMPKADATPQWFEGMLFHSLNGMVFALGYGLLIFPLLGKTHTTGRNVARGVGMGMVLATLSCLWWVPTQMTAFHPGFFSLNLGLSMVVAIYVWHLAWSLALGFIFNPQD